MNILTFDIEEWFHILDTDVTRTEAHWQKFECRIHANVDRLLELLERTGTKATFFCLGWVAKKYPEIIRKIDGQGHEIASHSMMHQLVYDLGPVAFEADVAKSVNTIEDIVGKKITVFRAPGFSIVKKTPWAFESLLKNGIETDCSVFPAHHGHGGFKEFGQARPSIISTGGSRIKEFPINLVSILGKSVIFSGGGYFRLFPYPLISLLFKQSDYVMTYFHPRDFDAAQPVIRGIPYRRVFKSYVGLKGAFAKLNKLLDSFEFTDVRGASLMIDWEKAPVVHM